MIWLNFHFGIIVAMFTYFSQLNDGNDTLNSSFKEIKLFLRKKRAKIVKRIQSQTIRMQTEAKMSGKIIGIIR